MYLRSDNQSSLLIRRASEALSRVRVAGAWADPPERVLRLAPAGRKAAGFLRGLQQPWRLKGVDRWLGLDGNEPPPPAEETDGNCER